MKSWILMLLLSICYVSLFSALVYFSWSFGRKVNYQFSYKSMVEETIQEKVKSECLK